MSAMHIWHLGAAIMYQKVNYVSLETGSRRRRVVSNSADVFHNVGLGL